jgi:hypothetical protein
MKEAITLIRGNKMKYPDKAICIGRNADPNGHSKVILVGEDLRAECEYHLRIETPNLSLDRKMCHEEWKVLYAILYETSRVLGGMLQGAPFPVLLPENPVVIGKAD